MTPAEAKRLALLIIIEEIGRSLDTSDEWVRHPETDELLSKRDVADICLAAKDLLAGLEQRLSRMGSRA